MQAIPGDPMHSRLILNGKAAGEPVVREAVEAMRADGLRLDVRVTWEQGDVARFVAEAIDTYLKTAEVMEV